MTIIWFVFAALAAAGAIWLWRLDARKNQPQQAPAAQPQVDDNTRQIAIPKVKQPSKGKHAKPDPVITEKATITSRQEEPKRDMWPGSSRRERRQWAMSHGFGYSKRDDFLHDEWTRGAAASGAPVCEVVSGRAGGYEMYLADIGGMTVMAVRRGSSSDVVVEAHRGVPQHAQDLVAVTSTAGFRILTNDAGATERFIDERVEAALTAMPGEVSQVWLETDWILAQFVPRSTPSEWDAAREPLALLADAARTLPPRTSVVQVEALSDLGPSRPMPEHKEVEIPAPEVEEPAVSLVQRPLEAPDLPSRMHSEVRGVVEPRMVGVDEVDAIADGTPKEKPVETPRVVREQRRPSSIFEDLAEEFGTNPLRFKDP